MKKSSSTSFWVHAAPESWLKYTSKYNSMLLSRRYYKLSIYRVKMIRTHSRNWNEMHLLTFRLEILGVGDECYWNCECGFYFLQLRSKNGYYVGQSINVQLIHVRSGQIWSILVVPTLARQHNWSNLNCSIWHSFCSFFFSRVYFDHM